MPTARRPHFAQYATGGLFPILESRTPELYEPLDEGWAAAIASDRRGRDRSDRRSTYDQPSW